MLEKKYYEIDEDLAKRGQQSYSLWEYKENSATISYRNEIDEVFELAESIKNEYGIDIQEKLQYWADRYAKKMADWINTKNGIDASHVSWAIAGPANYNMKKHNQRMNRLGKIFAEYKQFEEIKNKIKALKYYKPKIEKKGEINENYNFENDYFEVIQNEDLNRIQLLFNGKPDEEIRTILKKSGWRWSPKNNCWQRQLTGNARMNVMYIISRIKTLKGE